MMTARELPEVETYSLMIFDKTATNALLVGEAGHWQLPRVQIPKNGRTADDLCSAVQFQFAIRVICLFEYAAECRDKPDGLHFAAMRHWAEAPSPFSPVAWLAIAAVFEGSFSDRCEYSALIRCRDLCTQAASASAAAPFVTLEWFDELRSRTQMSIEPLGLRLTDRFRQWNASPSFSLVQLDTNQSAVWFKAVGEPNLREFAITRTLSSLSSRYLPAVIASFEKWHGWLAANAPGVTLAESHNLEHWTRAAEDLAELQIASRPRILAELLGAGACDLRVEALQSRVHPFTECMKQMMIRQTKVPPAPLGHTELEILATRIQDALRAYSRLPLPDSLGHLDPNPGNIIVGATHCVFLDWADAYVGNPIFAFIYFLEHFRRVVGTEDQWRLALIAAYRQRWQRVIPDSVLDAAFSMAPLLAVFAYAVARDRWMSTDATSQTQIAGTLRSLTRRMYRESDLLQRSRSCATC